MPTILIIILITIFIITIITIIIIISYLSYTTYIIKDKNVIHRVKILQLVRDQQASFVLQKVTNTVFKQMTSHMCVHSRQRVV